MPTPSRPCPSVPPRRSRRASCQRAQALHQPRCTWCSVTTTAGGGGRSITCRRRPTCTPPRRLPQVGARADRVLHHHTRLVAAPGLVVLRRPFAPRLRRPRGRVRLHKGRRRHFLRFQFADPLQRIRQLLAQRSILLPQRSVLGLPGRVHVVRNHTSSLTTKVESEHLPDAKMCGSGIFANARERKLGAFEAEVKKNCPWPATERPF